MVACQPVPTWCRRELSCCPELCCLTCLCLCLQQFYLPGLPQQLLAAGQLLPPVSVSAGYPVLPPVSAAGTLMLPPPAAVSLLPPPPPLPAPPVADPMAQVSDELQNTISSLMSKAQGLHQILTMVNCQKGSVPAAGAAPTVPLPPTPPADDQQQYVTSILAALQSAQAKAVVSAPPSPAFSVASSLAGSPATPQGQKRKYHHLLPSPEPSPENDFIGQHSQGLGGHYADSYLKRKRY